MDNTKHNLYTESLSSKINRLEHTIRELTALVSQREELNQNLTNKIIELNTELTLIKELNPDLRTDY